MSKKPSSTSTDGSETHLHRPNLNSLSFSLSFPGWRNANPNFNSWVNKMSSLHKPIWVKTGIYQAVISSTYRIEKHKDLVLCLAEKWSPETNTFVFPWGETSITLEDVFVLLGFPVLGLPVFACLDSEGEEIKKRLKVEWVKIRNVKKVFVTQSAWMKRFMDSSSNDNEEEEELEHVAFLVCWLSYFVFPSRFYHIYEAVFTIAIHLSRGVKIALAPAVLSHLYADLKLLKDHIKGLGESKVTAKLELTALFKVVQVWIWERFKEVRPRPNPLLNGEPRLALWHEIKREVDVRWVLDNTRFDAFEWRPYMKLVKKWEFPRFYPEKAMMVHVGSELDDEISSFVRCIQISQLVGIKSVEHYFPDRVASQFGLLQDVPWLYKRKQLSKEKAWDNYSTPIDDLKIYIPSRSAVPCFTLMYSEWWRKPFETFQNSVSEQNGVHESAETSKEKETVGVDNSFVVPSVDRTSNDVRKISKAPRRKYMSMKYMSMKYMQQVDGTISYVPSGSTMHKTSEDLRKTSKDFRNKRRELMRQKYTKQTHVNDESVIGCSQAQVPSDGDEDDPSVAQMMRRSKKKYSDVINTEGDGSEPLGKKARLEGENNNSVSNDSDEAAPPPETEEINEETNGLSPSNDGYEAVPLPENNSSDPLLGDTGVDIVMPPREIEQTCDDEVDVCGMINDGSMEPNVMLQEDGAIAEENSSSEAEKEYGDSLITVEVDVCGSNADTNEKAIVFQKLNNSIAVEKARADANLCSESEKEDDNDKLVKETLAIEEETLVPPQVLASPSTNETGKEDESNIEIAAEDGTQGHDLVHVGRSEEETKKFNEWLESLLKTNDDYDIARKKSLLELEELVTSLDERIDNAAITVEWLKKRKAQRVRQRNIAAAAARMKKSKI